MTTWNKLRGTLPPNLMATRRCPLSGRAIIHVISRDTLYTDGHPTLCGIIGATERQGESTGWADEEEVIEMQLRPWPDDAPVCRKCSGKLKKLRR